MNPVNCRPVNPRRRIRKDGRIRGALRFFDSYALHNDELAKRFGLLLVMEIHCTEMAFARENGAAALFHRLEQAGHYPYSDIDRTPVVWRDPGSVTGNPRAICRAGSGDERHKFNARA